MRVVLDTNIAFSAILNSNNVIAKIIFLSRGRINFYSTRQLLDEINEHKDKLKRISKATDEQINQSIDLIASRIRFIDVRLIPSEILSRAEELTIDVDVDDTEFVALTEHIKGSFWTGDKELKSGLIAKGWHKFTTADDLSRKLRFL